MQFGINWNDGYEVAVHMCDERGFPRWFPLRNFGDRQGDAKCFKNFDCPALTDVQIRMLARNFNRSVKYIRISGKRFIKQQKKERL